jgi:hypothetical protein
MWRARDILFVGYCVFYTAAMFHYVAWEWHIFKLYCPWFTSDDLFLQFEPHPWYCALDALLHVVLHVSATAVLIVLTGCVLKQPEPIQRVPLE